MAGDALELFKSGYTYSQVYSSYVQERGKFFGIDSPTAKGIALIRIAGMARIYKKDVHKLLSIWDEVPEDTRATLERELSIEGNEDNRAIFIGFGPAMLANGQNCAKKVALKQAEERHIQVSAEALNSATHDAMIIAMNVLAATFTESRKLIQPDCKHIFLSDCKPIASRWGKDRKDKILKKNILNDMMLFKSGKLRITTTDTNVPGYGVVCSFSTTDAPSYSAASAAESSPAAPILKLHS